MAWLLDYKLKAYLRYFIQIIFPGGFTQSDTCTAMFSRKITVLEALCERTMVGSFIIIYLIVKKMPWKRWTLLIKGDTHVFSPQYIKGSRVYMTAQGNSIGSYKTWWTGRLVFFAKKGNWLDKKAARFFATGPEIWNQSTGNTLSSNPRNIRTSCYSENLFSDFQNGIKTPGALRDKCFLNWQCSRQYKNYFIQEWICLLRVIIYREGNGEK